MLWLGHAAWVLVAVVIGVGVAWNNLGGPARWIVLAVIVYGVLGTPWVLALALRTRWNAPEAERRNRELLALTAERDPAVKGHS